MLRPYPDECHHARPLSAIPAPRATSSESIRPAISPSGKTASTPPICTAAVGMPAITAEPRLQPRIMSRGYLLVRVDGRSYGLPLTRVLEVADLAEVLEVPRSLPAMRGLTPVRGRLVPVVHLGALMSDRAPPPERGRTALVATMPVPASPSGAQSRMPGGS